MTIRIGLSCLAAAVVMTGVALSEAAALKNATPMNAGANGGVADSFQGDHVWYFWAEPGQFKLVFTIGAATNDSAYPGNPAAAIAFSPNAPDSKQTTKQMANGTIFEGSVTKRSKVYILVGPPNSPLVRNAHHYTLEASGAVSFGPGAGAASGDPIVGVYEAKRNDYGETQFLADGEVKAQGGETGHWSAERGHAGVYDVTVGNDPMVLKLDPGRGLADAKNDYVVFELKPG